MLITLSYLLKLEGVLREKGKDDQLVFITRSTLARMVYVGLTVALGLAGLYLGWIEGGKLHLAIMVILYLGVFPFIIKSPVGARYLHTFKDRAPEPKKK